MMNTICKTVLFPLLVLLCFSSANASVSEARTKALEHLMKRRPNAQFPDPDRVFKGSAMCIKIPYFDTEDFGRRKKYIAIYDGSGNWGYDKVPITANIKAVPGLESALINHELLHRIVHIDQIITSKGSGYDLKISSSEESAENNGANEMVFLNDKFERIKFCFGVNEKLLDKSLSNQLSERYGNIHILESLNYNDDKFFFVTFQFYDKDTRFWARSFYDKKNGWRNTTIYYRDYLKLPIELFSFVADQGGIESFHHIMKLERNDGCELYKLSQKGGGKVFFNDDLQTVDPKTCEVVKS